MSLVVTKAALAMKNAEANFKVVKFESHKPKKKDTSEVLKVELKTQDHHRRKELDLKSIRHEVVKFGMSGFDAKKKEEAKIALAISLGAKPPKKEYINYKKLMNKRKHEKLKEKADKEKMIKKTVLQSGIKKKKKNQKNDVGHFLSGYGKVQKKDLKKDDAGSKKKKKK